MNVKHCTLMHIHCHDASTKTKTFLYHFSDHLEELSRQHETMIKLAHEKEKKKKFDDTLKQVWCLVFSSIDENEYNQKWTWRVLWYWLKGKNKSEIKVLRLNESPDFALLVQNVFEQSKKVSFRILCIFFAKVQIEN